MENLNPPASLAMPFANNGKKNTIPTAPTGTNKASLTEGFPEITSEPTNENGIPPERADFNGVMNLNSQFYFAFQNGWWPTFSQEVSDKIGGYPLNSILWLFDTEKNLVRPLRSLIGNNTYNFNTDRNYIGQYWAEVVTDGQGMPVGGIYFSQSKEKTDNPGALPLFTGETIENFSAIYPVFYNYISKHPELCKTTAEYENDLTTYGECPFYVWDRTANTLRLPILKNYIKVANTSDGIKAIEAGLPNITGQGGNNWYDSVQYGTAYPISGAFRKSGIGSIKGSSNGGGDYYPFGVDFNASISSAVYGQSDTVTPASTTLYPWVVAYHAEQPDATQQINEILEAGTEQVQFVKDEGTAIINEAQAAANNAEEWSKKSRGLYIGTMYYSQSKLASDNPGALPLFTGETIASANTVYPDFYAWVQNHPELTRTAEEYEAALSEFGESPFYVLAGGAMRLPLLKNYVKMASDGDGILQGNKPDGFGVPDYSAGYVIRSGTVLTEDALVTCTGSPGGYGTINMYVDGKKVYQGGVSENTARPRAGNIYAAKGSVITSDAGTLTAYSLRSNSGYTTLYPWMCAYNAAVPASTAQAAEFQNALSGKVDLPAGKTQNEVDFVVDSYSDDAGNWYRVYKSGWVEQGGLSNTLAPGVRQPVTFLKPMANDRYSTNIVTMPGGEYTGTGVENKTSVSMALANTSLANVKFSWFVIGQGAQ